MTDGIFVIVQIHILYQQGSKGIRHGPIKWCTSPIIIYEITPSLDYNYLLKCLDTQVNETTNQNSIKVSKVVKPTNKKML